MSFLTTTPQLNPTVLNKNKTQLLESKELGVMHVFSPNIEEVLGCKDACIDNLTFEEFASMEKQIGTYEWKVMDSTDWLVYEINLKNLKTLLTDQIQNFGYISFSQIRFTLKTTLNAAQKGHTYLFYDPSPTSDFYLSMYGINWNVYNAALMDKIPIQPMTAQDISMILPFPMPFKFFPMSETVLISTLKKYIDEYGMGRLIAKVVVPLENKIGLSSIIYNLRGQILDLKVLATNYAN